MVEKLGKFCLFLPAKISDYLFLQSLLSQLIRASFAISLFPLWSHSSCPPSKMLPHGCHDTELRTYYLLTSTSSYRTEITLVFKQFCESIGHISFWSFFLFVDSVSLIFFCKFLNWSVVDLKWINFRCTPKLFSLFRIYMCVCVCVYMCIYIYNISDSFPL